MLGGDVNADIKRGALREQAEVFNHGGHQIAGEHDNQIVLLGQGNKHIR